jgi:hypothetical protein
MPPMTKTTMNLCKMFLKWQISIRCGCLEPHTGSNSKKVFKEAYGKSVIEVLKMVHQQAGRENDDCRLIFAERKNSASAELRRFFRHTNGVS